MPFYPTSPYLLPIVLLICSNPFMTFAWYGHLRFKAVPLWGVILASWAIAFVEYCFAVPANRYGNAVYSAAQLKTMQEVITLVVFAGFSLVYLTRADRLESPRRLRADFGWRVLHVSEMVASTLGSGSTALDQILASFSWLGMIFSENRFPLFGIVPWETSWLTIGSTPRPTRCTGAISTRR